MPYYIFMLYILISLISIQSSGWSFLRLFPPFLGHDPSSILPSQWNFPPFKLTIFPSTADRSPQTRRHQIPQRARGRVESVLERVERASRHATHRAWLIKKQGVAMGRKGGRRFRSLPYTAGDARYHMCMCIFDDGREGRSGGKRRKEHWGETVDGARKAGCGHAGKMMEWARNMNDGNISTKKSSAFSLYYLTGRSDLSHVDTKGRSQET